MRNTIEYVNKVLYRFKRWWVSRPYLLQEIEQLKQENESLRGKLLVLQNAKEQAERQADERRRDKDGLKSKLTSQKKAEDASKRTIEQLNAKITDLRDEIEKLKQGTKRK